MELDITNPLVYGVPTFCAFILLELAYSKLIGQKETDKSLYEWKDFGASTFMGAGSVVIGPLVKLGFTMVLFWGVYELFNPVTGVDAAGVETRTHLFGYASFGFAWWIWLICQFLDDFSYYWFHRLNHTVRFLWAAHIVHHSSENFNFGTGIRNGWFTLLYKPLFYMWLPAIGFHPGMVIICLGIESLWQFQLHTKYMPKLGFLEKFLNLHTQHQVHHSKNLEYLDKNHGGYLNIFDKIFGSWAELDEEVEPQFGVIHAPESNHPYEILMHEYRHIWEDVKSSKNLIEAFMYTFGPPGWRADGKGLTVRELQKKYKSQKEWDEDMARQAAEEALANNPAALVPEPEKMLV